MNHTFSSLFLSNMARVFVFSPSAATPSIDEVASLLPDGARIIAYNVAYPEMPHYFMVAFDELNETYYCWCDWKEREIPIVLEGETWRIYS